MATNRLEDVTQTPLEPRLAPRQAGQRTPAPLGEQPEVDFLSLAGPLHSLERVIGQWNQLVGFANVSLIAQPQILPLPPEVDDYSDRGGLRLAMAEHSFNIGPRLVATLKERLGRSGIADVFVEEGYFLSSSGSYRKAGNRPVMVGPWTVSWQPKHLKALHDSVQVRLARELLGASFAEHWGSPCRLALIDTGDEGAIDQVGFETGKTVSEPPSDENGHGTSVGSLIRMITPQVELHSHRVLLPEEDFVKSTILLNAVAYTTSIIGKFHIVVIPQRANLSPFTFGQRDVTHEIIRQNADNGQETPVVICAAGNEGRREEMSYPAVVPGVVVAVALDWSRRVANYNCSRPRSKAVFTVKAFGGTERDPMGHRARPGQAAEDLYGSSYAAALVAGALASRAAAR